MVRGFISIRGSAKSVDRNMVCCKVFEGEVDVHVIEDGGRVGVGAADDVGASGKIEVVDVCKILQVVFKQICKRFPITTELTGMYM